ncbi:replication-relaxation family protein [Actinomadura gamaensis]|uniref:Replication-relaxation family protein n=1 Tax=Actinomadura gamaensis TaxID=1763541 RepID=A0ABV9U9P5_9ACTN
MRESRTNDPSPRRPRRRRSAAASALLERLNDRDLAILETVWEHRVLTTDQLTALYFTGVKRARRRLAELHRLHALLRQRPTPAAGTVPYRWALGPTGAAALAAHRGVTLKELGYRQSTTVSYLLSQKVTHQIGVNQFFIQLHQHAHQPHTRTVLEQWWPEHRCHRAWGLHARPDAFGRWSQHTPGRPPLAVEFFLEHDTGTETLAKVVAKLAGYTELADATGMHTPVLFWLPGPVREANLRRLLGTPPIPVATAAYTPPTIAGGPFHTALGGAAHHGPAGPVWLPAGATGPRYRLAALADAWTAPDQPRTPPPPTGTPHATGTGTGQGSG